MDIVERLHQEIGGYTDAHLEKAETNMREAADEIERLRKRVERLREALQKCVTVLEIKQKRFEDKTAWGGYTITQRKARAAAAATGQMLNEIRKHVRQTLLKEH